MRTYDDYIQAMRDRWGLSKLELTNSSPNTIAEELSERVREREREEQAKYSLCYGSTQYQGKNIRIFFDKSRVQKVLI